MKEALSNFTSQRNTVFTALVSDIRNSLYIKLQFLQITDETKSHVHTKTIKICIALFPISMHTKNC